MSRSLQRIALNKVQLSKSRPVVSDAVTALAASMKQSGLLNPIIVKSGTVFAGIMTQGWKVLAGNHRVTAARKLDWTEIEAFVVEEDDLEAELIEIDENLCRAELTPAQRSTSIKRRKEIWTALHPNTGTSCPTIPERGAGRPEEFAAETAAISGQSKRDVNRHVARAEALGDDLDDVVGTSLDKGVELDALAKMPSPERRALIDKAKTGEQVTARSHDAHDRNVRLARQAVAELDRCAKHMDDEEFVDALTGITLSVSTKRIAAAILKAA